MKGFVQFSIGNKLRSLQGTCSTVLDEESCYWEMPEKISNLRRHEQQNEKSNFFLYYETSTNNIILSKRHSYTWWLVGDLFYESPEDINLLKSKMELE